MNDRLTLIVVSASLLMILACVSPSSGSLTPVVSLPTSPTPVPTVAPVSSPHPLTPSPIPSPTPPPPTPTPVEGPGYGGFFIDPEDDSIVYIFMVNPSQESAEYLGRTRLGQIVYEGTRKVREVRPIQGQYTYQQLQKWNRNLYKKTRLASLSELTASGVDTGSNRIEVGINCEANREIISQRLPSLLSGSDIPPEAIKVTVYPRERFAESADEFECAPSEVVDPATGISSPGFGGLFIDFDSRATNVFMLKPSQDKAEELALTVIGKDLLGRYPNVRALQGQYTWKQLLAWYDEWRNALPISLPDGVGVVDSPYPEPTMNRLSVRVTRDWSPEIEAAIEDWLKQVGIPREAVVLLE